MKVTAFVPIEIEIKGEDMLAEVHEQLYLIEKITNMSELNCNPKILVDCVFESEIIPSEE